MGMMGNNRGWQGGWGGNAGGGIGMPGPAPLWGSGQAQAAPAWNPNANAPMARPMMPAPQQGQALGSMLGAVNPNYQAQMMSRAQMPVARPMAPFQQAQSYASLMPAAGPGGMPMARPNVPMPVKGQAPMPMGAAMGGGVPMPSRFGGGGIR